MAEYNFGSIMNRDFILELKRMAEDVNVQGKTIQDLVADGQLTEEQYSNLIKTVNGMIKSGEVDKSDLTPELRSEVDKVRNKIDKGEVSIYDINKNRGKFDQTYLTQDLIDAITGAPGANILSEVAKNSIGTDDFIENSVTMDKASFLNRKNASNLFSGQYYTDISYASDSGRTDAIMTTSNSGRRTAMIEIENGKEYTVKKSEGGDTFIVMLTSKHPHDGMTDPLPYVYKGKENNDSQQHTFKNSTDESYLFVQTSLDAGETPEITVLDNTSTLDGNISVNIDDKDATFMEDRENLFDGGFTGNLSHNQNGTLWYTSNDNAKVAIVEIMNDAQYTVEKKGGGDRFYVMTFKEMPDNQNENYNETPLYKYTGPFDTLDETHTFYNDADANYLVVQVNVNSALLPELKITEGATDRYLPDRYLSNNVLSSLSEDDSESSKDSGDKKDPVYNFYTNLHQLYRKDTINNFLQNVETMSSSNYHSLYDGLLNDHGGTFQRRQIGTDDWDYPIYVYENIPPTYEVDFTSPQGNSEDGSPMKRPKIVMTAGIHGYERSVSYSMYYFFKELMENPTNNEIIEFLKMNVHFVGIPLICSSGWEDDTYHNRNDVNLNRDFSLDNGEGTQTENHIIQAEIENHLDMDFYIDFHNIQSNVKNEKIGFTMTDNHFFKHTLNHMYHQLGREWQKENPEFPQNLDYVWAHNARGAVGSAAHFVENYYNIPSALMEVPNELSWVSGGKFGEPTVRIGIEYIVNALIGALRSKY